MKRNVLMKAILISVVIALLSLAFTGCYTPPPTTGTVYIVVTGPYWYDLYMDYIGQFLDVPSGTYVLYNVPIGNHFFEAIDSVGSVWGYVGYTQYITAGNNYVYLSVIPVTPM